MKAKTLQIIWHGKQPVFSIDFDPCSDRFATAGGDNNVRVWKLSTQVEYLSTLAKHSATVNCVRWSPCGKYIASGGDDGSVLIWEQTTHKQVSFGSDEECIEHFKVLVVLRGATADLYDLAWSPCSKFIASSGIDSTTRIFSIAEQRCLHVLTQHCHYVQGVCWDPLNEYMATQSSDRCVHVYKFVKGTPKLLYKHSKYPISKSISISNSDDSINEIPKSNRLYQDENLNSFFRRLSYSPDGLILATPAGIHGDTYAAFLYDRALMELGPYAIIPGHKNPVIAIRFSPKRYKTSINPTISINYKFVFAIATLDSVVIYDTENLKPIAFLSDLHYAALTDLAWSNDGLSLLMTSTDGFCSLVKFEDGELGDIDINYQLHSTVTVDPAYSAVDSISSDTKANIIPIIAEKVKVDQIVVPTREIKVISDINGNMTDATVKQDEIIDSKEEKYSQVSTTFDEKAKELSVVDQTPIVAQKKRITPIFLGPNI